MNAIPDPGRRCASVAAALLSLAAALALGATPALAFPVSGLTAWRVAGDGTACGGTSCGDNGPATDAGLSAPVSVALDQAGSLYIADSLSHRVRRVTSAGVITTVAGTGVACPVATDPCGDGGPATALGARLNRPTGVAVDRAGNVFIADALDHRVRKVSASDGRLSTVAGTGAQCPLATNPCGDGGPAASANLRLPLGVGTDADGNVYVADTLDNRVRKVGANGTIASVAGDGNPCAAAPNCGDGGAATAAQLNLPAGVAVGPAGRLFIADTGDREVRAVAGGQISRAAGDGMLCLLPNCGDGGPATSARITAPVGLAAGPDGTLFVSDSTTNQVRRVSPAGRIARVGGDGTACASPPDCGDGGSATRAQFNGPAGLALDPAGSLYVADPGDHVVRWLAGPQAGPPGPPGAGGPGGAPGPTGVPGPPGRNGRMFVVAYQATAGPRRVAVRYALSTRAVVTLRVAGPGVKPVIVARRTGRAGLNVIRWNRRLPRRRLAPRGRYRLTVTAAVAGQRAASSLRVTLPRT